MKINILNHQSGETISYALPIFIGHLEPLVPSTFIAIWVGDAKKKLLWPVTNGKFRALVRLREGVNKVFFKCKDSCHNLILSYENPNACKIVRPVLIKCCDDGGFIQAPSWENSGPESAQRRIALGAQLLQTFTAEKLHDDGLGRHTFQLETNSDGEPLCHIFTSCLKLEEAVVKDGGELWCQFAKELVESEQFKDGRDCKFLAFMSFTRYNYTGPRENLPQNWSDSLTHTVGHTALGGGDLALFGTGSLHTWAERLEDVTRRFTDTRKIDPMKFLDDSAYRQFHWANYATGLGASLHELGHAFNLAHTSSGIMARGFDDMNKFFTVWETPCEEKRKDHNDSTITRLPPKPKVASKPPPLLIQVETAFQQNVRHSLETMTICNYDGSITKVTHEADGSQKVVLLGDCSEPSSSLNATRPQVLDLQESSTSPEVPVSLTPKSPPGFTTPALKSPLLEMDRLRSNEGDAKWHRSSSVLLRFHKWFNAVQDDFKGKPSFDAGLSSSPCGLRIVEVRHSSSGDVAHHWEFLQPDPPQTHKLSRSNISEVLNEGATQFTVVIEDNCGNILREDNVPLSSVCE